MLTKSRATATVSKRPSQRGRQNGREPIPVAVLGATGTVGQRFIQLLEDHPWFTVAEVLASDQSAGKAYAEAVGGRWKLTTRIPEAVARLKVRAPGDSLKSPVLFSSMDASIAGELEERYARAGHLVFSNSRNHRLDPLVPLVIPEVNRDHIELLDRQKFGGGGILTNPNCSAIVLVMALAPLHREFGVESLIVTTFQATSGAGYPGVPSLDILGNVIPYIPGEEPKMEAETNKILGRLGAKGIQPAGITVSASCHRVPVLDGHLMAMSVKLERKASLKAVVASLRAFRPLHRIELPSAPAEPLLILEQDDRPQPRLDVDRALGMGVTVGRIRPCPVLDWKFDALGHNTIRGAAGASILNAELLAHAGRI
jgi:aspartate-semialdehyde dehydrogenase